MQSRMCSLNYCCSCIDLIKRPSSFRSSHRHQKSQKTTKGPTPVCFHPTLQFTTLLTVWADSENGVNGSYFSKVKILRKRSSAHAQLIKISHFYVKTGHSGKLIVQSGLFICRSENTFKCFIRHVSTECIWQKYTFVGQIKFYLLSKLVNSVSDDEVNKSE